MSHDPNSISSKAAFLKSLLLSQQQQNQAFPTHHQVNQSSTSTPSSFSFASDNNNQFPGTSTSNNNRNSNSNEKVQEGSRTSAEESNASKLMLDILRRYATNTNKSTRTSEEQFETNQQPKSSSTSSNEPRNNRIGARNDSTTTPSPNSRKEEANNQEEASAAEPAYNLPDDIPTTNKTAPSLPAAASTSSSVSKQDVSKVKIHIRSSKSVLQLPAKMPKPTSAVSTAVKTVVEKEEGGKDQPVAGKEERDYKEKDQDGIDEEANEGKPETTVGDDTSGIVELFDSTGDDRQKFKTDEKVEKKNAEVNQSVSEETQQKADQAEDSPASKIELLRKALMGQSSPSDASAVLLTSASATHRPQNPVSVVENVTENIDERTKNNLLKALLVERLQDQLKRQQAAAAASRSSTSMNFDPSFITSERIESIKQQMESSGLPDIQGNGGEQSSSSLSKPVELSENAKRVLEEQRQELEAIKVAQQQLLIEREKRKLEDLRRGMAGGGANPVDDLPNNQFGTGTAWVASPNHWCPVPQPTNGPQQNYGQPNSSYPSPMSAAAPYNNNQQSNFATNMSYGGSAVNRQAGGYSYYGGEAMNNQVGMYNQNIPNNSGNGWNQTGFQAAGGYQQYNTPTNNSFGYAGYGNNTNLTPPHFKQQPIPFNGPAGPKYISSRTSSSSTYSVLDKYSSQQQYPSFHSSSSASVDMFRRYRGGSGIGPHPTHNVVPIKKVVLDPTPPSEPPTKLDRPRPSNPTTDYRLAYRSTARTNNAIQPKALISADTFIQRPASSLKSTAVGPTASASSASSTSKDGMEWLEVAAAETRKRRAEIEQDLATAAKRKDFVDPTEKIRSAKRIFLPTDTVLHAYIACHTDATPVQKKKRARTISYVVTFDSFPTVDYSQARLSGGGVRRSDDLSDRRLRQRHTLVQAKKSMLDSRILVDVEINTWGTNLKQAGKPTQFKAAKLDAIKLMATQILEGKVPPKPLSLPGCGGDGGNESSEKSSNLNDDSEEDSSESEKGLADWLLIYVVAGEGPEDLPLDTQIPILTSVVWPQEDFDDRTEAFQFKISANARNFRHQINANASSESGEGLEEERIPYEIFGLLATLERLLLLKTGHRQKQSKLPAAAVPKKIRVWTKNSQLLTSFYMNYDNLDLAPGHPVLKIRNTKAQIRIEDAKTIMGIWEKEKARAATSNILETAFTISSDDRLVHASRLSALASSLKDQLLSSATKIDDYRSSSNTNNNNSADDEPEPGEITVVGTASSGVGPSKSSSLKY